MAEAGKARKPSKPKKRIIKTKPTAKIGGNGKKKGKG